MVIRAAAAAAVILAAALGVFAVHTHRERVRMRDEADYEALRRMDRYCDLVREGFRQDAADLRGDTVKQRENAADRFMEPVTLHSWNDVTFCSAVEPVVDKTSCWLGNDFECIAKQAESVAAMIPIAAATEDAIPRLRQHCRHVHTTMGMAAREAQDRWPGTSIRPTGLERTFRPTRQRRSSSVRPFRRT